MLLLSKSTSTKNNRRGGGRENKLKSSWEIKTKLCKSWEIKRNYANWRKLFVWLQLRSRHPFADVAERSGDNFQLFLKKMFLCFARKWNCQSEKFLVSSERFDNSWTPTWSKSIWSIVFSPWGGFVVKWKYIQFLCYLCSIDPRSWLWPIMSNYCLIHKAALYWRQTRNTQVLWQH